MDQENHEEPLLKNEGAFSSENIQYSKEAYLESNKKYQQNQEIQLRLNSSVQNLKNQKRFNSLEEDLESRPRVLKVPLDLIKEEQRERSKSSQILSAQEFPDDEPQMHNKLLFARSLTKTSRKYGRLEENVTLTEQDIQQFGLFKQIKVIDEEETQNELRQEMKKTDRLNQLNSKLSARSRLEMRADKPGKKSIAMQVDFLGFKQKDQPTFKFTMNNKKDDHMMRSKISDDPVVGINEIISMKDTLSSQPQKEIKYWKELKTIQKIQIVFYNCQEAVILSAMLANAVLAFSLLSIITAISTFILIFRIDLARNNLERTQNNIFFKQMVVLAQIISSLCLIIGKVVFIFKGKDPQSYSVLLQSLGFVFDQDKQIVILKSIIHDILIVCFAFLYKTVSLRFEQRNFDRNLNLKRVYFKIVPISRQRALENQQIVHEKLSKQVNTEYIQAQRRFSAKKALSQSLISFPDEEKQYSQTLEEQSKLTKREFVEEREQSLGYQSYEKSRRNSPQVLRRQTQKKRLAMVSEDFMEIEKTKRTTHTVHQQIIGHSYFGELHHLLYYILCLIILIDIAVLKAAPQLFILAVILLQAYWKSKSHNFTGKKLIFQQLKFLNYFETWATIYQVILSLQLALQFAFQISLLQDQADKLQSQLKTFLAVCGLRQPLQQENWQSYIVVHVVLVSFTLSFGQLFKQGKQNFESEKEIKTNELDRLKALGNLPVQKKESQEIVSNQKLFLLWIFKYYFLLSSIGGAFLYHTYPSIMLLVWACHSNFYRTIRSFGEVTWYIYCPVFIFIILYFYSSDIYLNQHQNRDDLWKYGIFTFKYSVFEQLLIQIQFFIFMIWVSNTQKLKLSDESYEKRFLTFAKNWSDHKNSFSLQNVILLIMIPLFQYCLQFLIFYLGIGEFDFNHIVYLIFFVVFFVVPRKQKLVTEVVLVFCCIFILIKYIIAIVINQKDNIQEKNIFKALGFYPIFNNQYQKPYFILTIDYFEFLTLLISGFYYFVLQIVGKQENEEYNEAKFNYLNFNPQSVVECYALAKHNLRVRFKQPHRIIQFFYNFKRALFLYLVLLIFYIITLNSNRSLVTWLLLILTNFLFYLELTINTNKNPQDVYKKIRAWKIMITYSAIVLISYITYLFLRNYQEKTGEQIQWLKGIVVYEDLIGFVYNSNHGRNSQIILFAPFMAFLILSFAIKNELKKWKEYDKIFKQDLLNLGDKESFTILNITTLKSPLIEKEKEEGVKSYEEQVKEYLYELQNNREEIGLKFNQIRFSPLYQAYSLGIYWKFIDFVATYFHLIVQILVFYFIIYWWLNIALVLQVFSFVIFNLKISKKMLSLKQQYLINFNQQQKNLVNNSQLPTIEPQMNQEQKSKSKKEKKSFYENFYLLIDSELSSQVKNFDDELKKNVIQERTSNWHRQLVLIQLTLVITYATYFLDYFIDHDAPIQIDKDILKKILYYAFVSGFYVDQKIQSDSKGVQDVSFILMRVVYGYLVLLVLQLFENISLNWLENRFGCDQKAYKAIDQFQMKLQEIDKKIEETKKILLNIDLIEKKRKMKILNNQKQQTESKFVTKFSFKNFIEPNPKDLNQTNRKETFSNNEDLSFDSNIGKNSARQTQIFNIEDKETIQKELRNLLLVDQRLCSKRGLKMILENTIILTLILSAIGKMNIISCIYFVLIIFNQFTYFNSTTRIRIVIDLVTIIILIRFILIISNIEMNVQPMDYPQLFKQYETPVDLANQFRIPWLFQGLDQSNQEGNKKKFKLYYFLALVGVKDQINSMIFDMILICLGYFYYMNCMFYCLDINFKVQKSEDTNLKLDFIIQCEPNNPESKSLLDQLSRQSSIENQNDFQMNIEKAKGERISQEINKIRGGSNQYRIYKFFQRSSYSFYTIVIGLGLFLALISQTIFSIPLLIFFCVTTLYYPFFLDVRNATQILKPCLQFIIVPIILFEQLIQILYQIPNLIDSSSYGAFNQQIENFLFLQHYWDIIVGENMKLSLDESQKQQLYSKLATKAILLFLVNTQITILNGKSFRKLNQAIEIGNQKGKAIILWANNLKVKSYLKYQIKNLKKEQMIVRVKTSFDSWRALFEAKFQFGKKQMNEGLKEQKSVIKENESDFEQIKDQEEGIVKQQSSADQFVLQNEAAGSTLVENIEQNQEKQVDPLRFQSVNPEFMALHQWQLKIRQKTTKKVNLKPGIELLEGEDIQGQNSEEEEKDKQDSTINLAYDTDYLKIDQQSELESDKLKYLFKEKKRNLPFCARQYLKLRKWGLNPILFVNNKNHIKEVTEKVKAGETKILSSIEIAILDDIRNPAGKRLEKQLAGIKMAMRYAKLLLQLFESNLDHIAYFAMILQFILATGILTVVYPLAVFGYALMIEPRPTKLFWQFIIIYTQILMIIEFICSLRFMTKDKKVIDSVELQNTFNSYFLGLNIIYGSTDEDYAKVNLLRLFLPKVIVLFASIHYIHGMVILRFYEKSHHQYETITNGYIRYILGKYQCNLDEIDQKSLLPNFESKKVIQKDKNEFTITGDQSFMIIQNKNKFEFDKPEVEKGGYLQRRYKEIQEFNYICFSYKMNCSIDDFNINYFSPNKNNQQQINIGERVWNYLMIDEEYVKQYNQDLRPFMSDYDPFEADKFNDEKYFKKLQAQVHAANNDFVQVRHRDALKVIQKQKIEKPTLFQNIFINNDFMDHLFPSLKIQKPGVDFYQATVVIQIFLVIVLLTCTSSMEGESSTFITQWNTSNLSSSMVIYLICLVIIILIDRIIYKSKTLGNSDSKKQKDQKQINNLFAQNQITVRNVFKFWFQWILLLLVNIFVIYTLPVKGNHKTNPEFYYCHVDPKKDIKCNDMDDNLSIRIFYLFCSFYFYLQALQIKFGQPEILSSYFMIGQYHYLNKWMFLIFYNIPFMFELRTFIDWLIVQSSLDVFQWIKLAQVQVDLYKSKCNNQFYQIKTVGEILPRWYRFLIGPLLVVLVLLSVFSPMILFSSLNSFGTPNSVTQLTVSLILNVENTPYTLYQSSQTLYQKVFDDKDNDNDFKTLNFQNYPQLSIFNPNQVQIFMMNKDASNQFIPTISSLTALQGALEKINKTSDNYDQQFNFLLKYEFLRSQPVAFTKPEISQKIVFEAQQNQTKEKINFISYIIKQKINATVHDCSNQPEQNFTNSQTIGQFNFFIQLTSTSNTGLYIENLKKINKNLNLTIDEQCQVWSLSQTFTDQFKEEKEYYEKLKPQITQQGISFFVFSNYSLPSFLNYSLISFYIVIIYTISKLIRLGFVPVTSAIFINDAPNPDDLLDLCEIIHLFRMKEMFYEEEELYFLLIDIMRSPEIFKQITGNYKKSREQFVQIQQQDKQKLKRD